MHRFKRRLYLTALMLPLPAFADSPPPSTVPDAQQVVVVKGELQDHESKSYADMMKAVRMFAAYQALHPETSLRFRLYQRKPGSDIGQLSLALSDPESGQHTPVELGPDHSFTLPELPPEQWKSAIVKSNMPPGSLVWSAEIVRQPLQRKHLILGDLRMECELDVNAANLSRGVYTPAALALKATTDLCKNKSTGYERYGDEAVFSVHIRHGGKERSLLRDDLYGGNIPAIYYGLLDWPYLLRDQVYRPPIYDSNWPDDTEIDLVYLSDKPAESP